MKLIKKAKNDLRGKSATFLADNTPKYANLERKKHKDYYQIAFG